MQFKGLELRKRGDYFKKNFYLPLYDLYDYE